MLATVLAFVVAPPASANAPASDRDAAAFEVEFMEEMIDHHQMAVHMSHLCIDKAVHQAVRALCQTILSTQMAEIEQMQAWLVEWYGIEHEPSMDDPAHHEQMMQLESLSGDAFEAAFLEMMIEHHAMAVVDGRECMKEAEHSALRRLCQTIFTSQWREIVRMQVWLCRWHGECDFRSPLARR